MFLPGKGCLLRCRQDQGHHASYPIICDTPQMCMIVLVVRRVVGVLSRTMSKTGTFCPSNGDRLHHFPTAVEVD